MANFSIENDCSLIPLDMSAVIQSVTSSFRTGAELKSGQPTKSSCQSARYFSRSFALTYSQYAFSRFQTCVSSLAEFCAMSRCYQRRWTAAIISWERGARLREDGRWKSRKIAETGYRKADIGKKWNRRKQKQRRFGLILVVLVTFCENSLETEEI